MATTRSRQTNPSRNTPPKPPIGNGRGGGGGNGRGPKKRRNPFVQRLVIGFQLISAFIMLGIIIFLGAFYYLYTTLPSAENQIRDYKAPGRAMIYSSDGVLLANLFQQNRTVVTIDKIPQNLQNATVSIEDQRFYTNVGIDFKGIGRALYRDFMHGRSKEGASTITQQLVRNIGIGGVGREKTITRKIKEALYAIQIERNYSKQQILEMYLNQVYYGSGAYGVESASETYFNKPAMQLDLAQCALIAGLPKSPGNYSPYINVDNAHRRRDLVLGKMLELHYITTQQCADALDEPITLGFAKSPQGKSHTYHAPYFVDYVVKQLAEKFGTDFIERGGLNITTTLNWEMQDQAEKAVENGVQDAAWRGATQAALVAMDPHTGFIKAMVGGVDYGKSQFNIAADGRRQPGSSFKPIIYAAAIDSGLINENTRILDAPVTFPGATGPWSPKNDDHIFRGWVTAKRAMALSINVPAVKVLKLVGPDTAIRYANMMGVESPLQPYLTLALGASAVTPLEMACVYSVIDNGGARPSPLCVEDITDNQGNSVYKADPQMETTPISKDALTQVKDMLRSVVTEGTASGILGDGSLPTAAGKTGTTQSHYDVWFDGFTDDLVCTVWAGHPSRDARGHAIYGIPMNGEAFGATICAPIWKRFMIAAEPILAAERAKAPKPAPTPPTAASNAQDDQSDDTDNGDNATITGPTVAPTADDKDVTVWIDNNSGQRVAPNSPNSHTEQFAKGTEPPMDGVSPNAPTAPQTVQTPTSPQNTQPNDNTDNSTSPPTNSAPATPTPSPVPQSAPPSATEAIPSKQRTVTVTICTDSGLLATTWCPSTIQKTFPIGQEPKRYCNIHHPPPGEQ